MKTITSAVVVLGLMLSMAACGSSSDSSQSGSGGSVSSEPVAESTTAAPVDNSDLTCAEISNYNSQNDTEALREFETGLLARVKEKIKDVVQGSIASDSQIIDELNAAIQAGCALAASRGEQETYRPGDTAIGQINPGWTRQDQNAADRYNYCRHADVSDPKCQ